MLTKTLSENNSLGGEFKVYELDGGQFRFISKLDERNIIDYAINKRAFPNYDEAIFTLKTLPEIIKRVPRKSVSSSSKPLIFSRQKKVDGQLIEDDILFAVGREYILDQGQQYVRITLAGINYFLKDKLVISNKNYPNSEYEQLPEDFAKYVKTGNLKTILEDVLSINLIQCLIPTFGRISTTSNQARAIKGVSSYEVNSSNASSKTMNSDITNFIDFQTNLYELFRETLEARISFFDETNTSLKVTFEAGKTQTLSLLQRKEQVSGQGYGVQAVKNAVFGYANPNNDVYIYDLDAQDFTTIELAEDTSFINGSNSSYLLNTSITTLSKEIKERFVHALKINYSKNMNLKAGDFVNFLEMTWKVNAINEAKSVNSFSIDLEIEEV